MKLSLLLLTLMSFSLSSVSSNNAFYDSINSIIGNESFINKFGKNPDINTDEKLRIKTHLEYAEKILRNKNVSNLPENLKSQRIKNLNLLHKYWQREKFPKNYDIKNSRKPCFIDKDGTICAVGYLVQQTEGNKLANEINSKFKYSLISEMKDQKLLNWVKKSGLTLEEVATIQPNYSYNYTIDGSDPRYAISSLIFWTISFASIYTLNSDINTNFPFSPTIGMVSGASSTVYGMTNFGNNFSQNTISALNIGVGLTTLAVSTAKLTDRALAPKKDDKIHLNFYNSSTTDKSFNFGIQLSKNF
jgi:hypothetical protein